MRLSRQHALYSALTFIYTHALDDYVAPIAELISAIITAKQAQQQQQPPTHERGAAASADSQRVMAQPEQTGRGVEASQQRYFGFKLMAYMRCCLQGSTYPPGVCQTIMSFGLMDPV